MRISVEPSIMADQPELLRELTPVPAPSDVVCPNCHTWKMASEHWCENCQEVHLALGTPPLSTSCVTLYAKPSSLREWLTHYKGRPNDLESWKQEAEDMVTAIAARFIQEHGSRLAQATGGIDKVLVVPSTDRLPPHPLELVLEGIGLDISISRTLHRTNEPIGFRKPNADAYRSEADLNGQRIFLMDDVYTTGAHLNSAASALRQAGAQVVGALVLARRINPAHRDEIRSLWESANQRPFTWMTGPYIEGAPA